MFEDSMELPPAAQRPVANGDAAVGSDEKWVFLSSAAAAAAATSVSPGTGKAPPRPTRLAVHLACQYFVELVLRHDVDEAVRFMQRELSVFADSEHVAAADKAHLHEVVALLAYETPAASPLARLCQPAQRAALADMVNNEILVLLGRPRVPALERVLQQLVTAQWALRKHLHSGCGTVFDLNAAINDG